MNTSNYAVIFSSQRNSSDHPGYERMADSEHKIAQEFGRAKWYESFTTRVCKVEREYNFAKDLS